VKGSYNPGMVNSLILGIDTSCDDTSAAVVDGTRILSNIVSSQVKLHQKYGGVMPTVAKLAHQERIQPVIELALKRADVKMEQIDAIAVTAGPGLAISLEVGIAKAKELATQYNKPLLPINHMEGHLLSSLATSKLIHSPQPTAHSPLPIAHTSQLGLLISGKHTEFIKINAIGDYERVGQTLDDACGEAFDKSARLLGLGYPGAPVLSKFAAEVRKDYEIEVFNESQSLQLRIKNEGLKIEWKLPIPMAYSQNLDMSFSGLKTAFWQLVQKLSQEQGDFSQERVAGVALKPELTKALCLLFEEAAVETVVRKLDKALETYQPKRLLIGGGVISNVYLRKRLRQVCRKYGCEISIPYSKRLFMDNAAMIAVTAYLHGKEKKWAVANFDRQPNWEIDQKLVLV
jgi:N6-L-threonylcarbamoyladenine synthase